MSDSADEQDPSDENGEQESLSPTPIEPPTPSPDISPWPLPADLFILQDDGRVWRQPRDGDEVPAEPVTREGLTIRDFAVAPGGGWLIYRTDIVVATTSLDGQRGQILAQNVSLSPESQPSLTQKTLAWSSDASKVAFATADGFQVLLPSGDENFEPLYSPPISEGAPVDLSWSLDSDWLLIHLADGSAVLYEVSPQGESLLTRWLNIGAINDFTWLSDGRLAFAPAEGGLALVTPGDSASRVFVMPQDRQVTLPTQWPDGTLAFYAHSGSVAQPGFLHTANPDDLSFSIENNVPLQTKGRAWDPSGKRIIGPGSSPDTLSLLDPRTGGRGTLDVNGRPLGAVWGDAPPRGVPGLSMPTDLYFLSPQAGVVQVWRLPANGDPPQAITQANEDVTAYHVGEGGTQIVYTSGRTIYRLVANTLDVTEIATLSVDSPVPTGTPAIAPGGRSIAYADDDGLYVYNLDTESLRRLVRHTLSTGNNERQVQIFDQPRWSPDRDWLLVRANFFEGSDQVLLQLPDEDRALSDPIFLDLFGADGKWTSDGRAYLYSDGSLYANPFLTMVQPSEDPGFARLLNLPIVDAQPMPDGRIAVLRVPAPGTVGPTVVSMFSIQTAGTNLTRVSGSYALEQAILSPDTSFIAGLAHPQLNDSAQFTGQLAVIDTETGEMVLIASTSDVYALQWER